MWTPACASNIGRNLIKWELRYFLKRRQLAAAMGGLVVVRDFEEINRLLDDIGAGNIRFSVAPIEITLKPYWPTLRREWKNARSILEPDEKQFKVPTANFGVPKGTILPWYPTGEFILGLDSESEETTILAPDRWTICDGQMGTPDLRGRFIKPAIK